MKLSVSIPDPLWNDAQRLGDGPSDIVQNAIRSALGTAATTRPVRLAVDLDDEDRTNFKIAAAQARTRMVNEYKNGYRFGVWLANAITSDDAELLTDRTAAIEALREVIGSFDIPLEGDGSDELPDDIVLLQHFGQFDGTISLPLFLMVRGALLDPADQRKYGFEALPDGFDEPDAHLEALMARAGVTDDLYIEDGYRKIRISRRYADGIIDAMLAVWEAATSSLDHDMQGLFDDVDELFSDDAAPSGSGQEVHQ